MLHLAVDDTDSPEGGCTTALAAPLAALFPDLTPEGAPRLVRLNPNVPWKTRGNAAIALRFRGDHDLDAALALVRGFVEEHAQQHPRTEPGVVVSATAPDRALYEATVTRIVERTEVDEALRAVDARAWGGRGVIGAAAAMAWDPAPGDPPGASWERIAYRAPERLGTPRAVDAPWVREIEWSYHSIFDSYDLANHEVVCVPSGPDPVLWGLRGDDPEELERASALLGPERPARETLFLTNQASDDHLRDRRAGECREYDSARLHAHVAATPVETNGTVYLELEDKTGRLRAAAYPPTRAFRHVVRALAPGDEVTVCGGIHAGKDGRLTLGIEKLHVGATTPRATGPPTCPRCQRSMKSRGKGKGYRCAICGTHAGEARAAVPVVRPGWHEVPPSARRHLAMPLRLTRGASRAA